MNLLLSLRNLLKENLTREQIDSIKQKQRLKFRWLQYIIYKTIFTSNLKVLAILYNTDKWGSHWYAQHYQFLFSKYRHKKINILEIGIGGYDDPEDGGGSLRMWKAYFPKAQIYGIDIYDKSPHNENRIQTFKGSQIDENFLTEVVNSIGQIDIIIDDGSHINDHVIKTFCLLFPSLKDGGIYVIEDTQTSYWPSYGGSSDNLNASDTTPIQK